VGTSALRTPALGAALAIGYRYRLWIAIDIIRDFTRAAVQVHLMHHACEGEVHGAALIEELARHGYRLSPGTVYPMLHRLQAAGLLTSREVLVDGRLRRIYRASPEGRRAFAACRGAVQELADEVLGP
jgi:DNA-binding PadR family transcriptional regulator